MRRTLYLSWGAWAPPSVLSLLQVLQPVPPQRRHAQATWTPIGRCSERQRQDEARWEDLPRYTIDVTWTYVSVISGWSASASRIGTPANSTRSTSACIRVCPSRESRRVQRQLWCVLVAFDYDFTAPLW